EQVSSAGLGPGWQCSRVAFVLTTCTRAGEAEREARGEGEVKAADEAKAVGEVKAIPVRAKDDCPPEP
ncbi:hypothetical protein ABTN87_19300, partial [Acinetobacter baumannii]